jgi:hypothetical protein
MQTPFEIDPYAVIRPAMSPEHENLAADEVTLTLGGVPAAVALHQLLNSQEIRQAVVASLLGNSGRRFVPLNGANVPIPVYFRMISRLCREAVEQGATESAEAAPIWEGTPEAEYQLPLNTKTNTLSASVGRKGKNLPDDVKLIQHLLNSNLPLPSAPLPENGVIDANTIAAIEGYQRRALGETKPDGRVDPHGTTFTSLAADKFCFLPHFVQPLGATAAVNVNAASMNPGFLTATNVTRNAVLQAIVERRILSKDLKLKALRFALVDLTGTVKRANPQFAGNRETEQGGLGSTSKIACMYAAYQLKFDLEELSRRQGITNEADLFRAARGLWKAAQKPDPAKVTTLFPAAPKIETNGKLIVIDGKPVVLPSGFSLPDLEQIFTSVPGSAGGLTLRFKGSDQIAVDPAVQHAHVETQKVREYIARDGESLNEVRKLSFAERLFLLIDASDDAAAHSCIENIGFEYIASALWQSDFYNPQRGGGLWEASTHDKPFRKRWIKPPVPRMNPRTDFVSANACSVAALLTLIEQGRLVNREACIGMKHLMNKKKPGIGSNTESFFLQGLDPLFTLDRVHSKLGVGDFNNDAAIIVRTVHPDPADSTKDKQICYVAAGFDEPLSTTADLQKLIVELDKCILENNGLLAP